jgi:F0F1-type ATP synthase assembly protein I
LDRLLAPLQNEKKNDRYWAMRQVGLLTTIPVLLAVSPLIGFFMGRFLDGKLSTDPIFTIVFLILGFIAGARQTARVIKLAGKEQKRNNDGS